MAEFANILWPLILSKAVCKLLAFKWRTSSEQVGEGAVMYALTGLLPCTYSIDSFRQGWGFIEDALSNQSFAEGKAYVVGYSRQGKKPIVLSNHVDQKTAFKMKARQPSAAATPLRSPP